MTCLLPAGMAALVKMRIYIFAISFLIFFCGSNSEVNDYRRCADSECKKPIGKGITTLQYKSINKGILSLPAHTEVYIFSKEGGDRAHLFGIEIQGKRGYAPSNFIKALTNYVKDADLIQVPSEKQLENSSENGAGKEQKQEETPKKLQDEQFVEETVHWQQKEETGPPPLNQQSEPSEVKHNTKVDQVETNEKSEDTRDKEVSPDLSSEHSTPPTQESGLQPSANILHSVPTMPSTPIVSPSSQNDDTRHMESTDTVFFLDGTTYEVNDGTTIRLGEDEVPTTPLPLSLTNTESIMVLQTTLHSEEVIPSSVNPSEYNAGGTGDMLENSSTTILSTPVDNLNPGENGADSSNSVPDGDQEVKNADWISNSKVPEDRSDILGDTERISEVGSNDKTVGDGNTESNGNPPNVNDNLLVDESSPSQNNEPQEEKAGLWNRFTEYFVPGDEEKSNVDVSQNNEDLNKIPDDSESGAEDNEKDLGNGEQIASTSSHSENDIEDNKEAAPGTDESEHGIKHTDDHNGKMYETTNSDSLSNANSVTEEDRQFHANSPQEKTMDASDNSKHSSEENQVLQDSRTEEKVTDEAKNSDLNSERISTDLDSDSATNNIHRNNNYDPTQTGDDHISDKESDNKDAHNSSPEYKSPETVSLDMTQAETEPPVDKAPVIEPPLAKAPVTDPPVTEPPLVKAQVTEPSVTEAPITEPSVTEPPVTEPSVTEAPVTDPPVTDPPVTDPPVPDPPVTEPLVTDPSIVKTPVAEPPVNNLPVNEPPITEVPVAKAPVTESPVTKPLVAVVNEAPVTEPSVVEPPITKAPVTEPPVTEPPATEPPATKPPDTESTHTQINQFSSNVSDTVNTDKSLSSPNLNEPVNIPKSSSSEDIHLPKEDLNSHTKTTNAAGPEKTLPISNQPLENVGKISELNANAGPREPDVPSSEETNSKIDQSETTHLPEVNRPNGSSFSNLTNNENHPEQPLSEKHISEEHIDLDHNVEPLIDSSEHTRTFENPLLEGSNPSETTNTTTDHDQDNLNNIDPDSNHDYSNETSDSNPNTLENPSDIEIEDYSEVLSSALEYVDDSEGELDFSEHIDVIEKEYDSVSNNAQEITDYMDKLRCYVQAVLDIFPDPLYSVLMDLGIKGISPRVTVFTAFAGILTLILISTGLLIQRASKESFLRGRLCSTEMKLFKLVAENQAMKEDIEANRLKISCLEESLDEAQISLLPLQEELKQSKSHSSKLHGAVQEMQMKLSAQQDSVESLRMDLANKEHELSIRYQAHQNAVEEVNTLQEKLCQSENNLVEVQIEICRLSVECSELKTQATELEVDRDKLVTQNVEQYKRLGQLQCDVETYQKEHDDLMNKLNAKNNENETLTKALQLVEPLGNSDGDLENTEKKIKDLLNVSQLSLKLERAEFIKASLEENLKQETKRAVELEARFIEAEESSKCTEQRYQLVLQEKMKAVNQLEALTNYFKETEMRMQKELGTQEALRQQKEEDLSSAGRKAAYFREETNLYKSQIDSLKKELEETENSYKSQVAVQEKKAHENWIAARTAERKLEETKQESTVLRQRLTMLERDYEGLKNSTDGVVRPIPTRPAGPNGEITFQEDAVDPSITLLGNHKDLDLTKPPSMSSFAPIPMPMPPPPPFPPPMFGGPLPPPPFMPPHFGDHFGPPEPWRMPPHGFERGRRSPISSRGQPSPPFSSRNTSRQSSPPRRMDDSSDRHRRTFSPGSSGGRDYRDSGGHSPPHPPSLPHFHDLPPPVHLGGPPYHGPHPPPAYLDRMPPLPRPPRREPRELSTSHLYTDTPPDLRRGPSDMVTSSPRTSRSSASPDSRNGGHTTNV